MQACTDCVAHFDRVLQCKCDLVVQLRPDGNNNFRCLYAGYKANIVFLRNFLAPIYEIHDLKQNPDNEFEIITRWSFSMQFWWLRYLPPIKV